MADKNITNIISEYISKQKISIMQIQKDTGIQKEKLEVIPKENLTATELLELCAYLNLPPEKLEKE